ncbi:protein COFACTOR ASSEMBLY OF COMPLEX C SUBUNIT B CCB1, chloroplastic [Quillaja saponaria]|uniref:Protein COFACTOR ASSEMBLY OF COMPLEX C SUBUNIT B CCB1, chloroplastic n=1 Tax=Quillaja saponaria TaxID=32244 RepID=A0AAD7PZ17_QUISA|nr:protein COFACTOR ASSEMBLY OF COMPLEX C SUBUNIT B CCB1, chloroplastic [Quillaja saponaria]
MAAKLLSPHPKPLCSLSLSGIKFENRGFIHPQVQPWFANTRPKKLLLRVSLHDPMSSAASALVDYVGQQHPQNPSSLVLLADTVGYSLASYYTSLGLFVISVPGLWSLIKRSVKSKIVKKTFIGEGEGKKVPNQIAGEILSFFSRNNFVVTDRGEAITFEGMMVPSRGQAALLTFCTCISLASVALVLTITFPDVGNSWFWITIVSPLAGAYYWKRASRKEQIKVKMIVAEDGILSEIVVQGDDQQVEQLRKELQLSEKGMVYVKGIFEK